MQLLALFFYILLALPLAQSQFTLTSDGCVDASGFDSCMSSVTASVQQCVQKNCNGGTCNDYNDCGSNDSNCYSACICGGYQSWINCALSHCWNRTYSCEVQDYIISAVQQCDFALSINYPPYFPSPAGQPGACSCQIGIIFTFIEEMVANINKCTSKGSSSASCYCCGASQALSSLTDVCPNSNISEILSIYSGMQNFQSAISKLNSTECNNAFAPGLDCTAPNLGFQEYNNSQFYDWANLPAFGDAPVTDLPGQLGAPLSSAITWQFFKGAPAVTALAATGSGSGAKPTASGSAPTASNSAGGGSGGSVTASASAGAQPTKASNGASQSSVQISVCAAIGFSVIFAVFNA
ncbi:hypothetical protein N431DRAFT_478054 [Stipitochalara longipes BDJ]|nr:hypothetical protein N431DRAFT_478054 [Stipitochalara longipes BDJ]